MAVTLSVDILYYILVISVYFFSYDTMLASKDRISNQNSYNNFRDNIY